MFDDPSHVRPPANHGPSIYQPDPASGIPPRRINHPETV
jgi:hypothetical protein